MHFFFVLALVISTSISTQALAKKILLIGDTSIVSTFGQTLQRELWKEKNHVLRLAAREARVSHFLDPESEKRTVDMGAALIFLGRNQIYKPGQRVILPRLSSVLPKEKPEVVVLSFGDAMAEYRLYRKVQEEVGLKRISKEEKKRLLRLNLLPHDTHLQAEMKKLKDLVLASKARCIVITPPFAVKSKIKVNERVTEMSTLIWETMRPECFVINTSKDLQNHTPMWESTDGLSYEGQSGKDWALAALPLIEEAISSDQTL